MQPSSPFILAYTMRYRYVDFFGTKRHSCLIIDIINISIIHPLILFFTSFDLWNYKVVQNNTTINICYNKHNWFFSYVTCMWILLSHGNLPMRKPILCSAMMWSVESLVLHLSFCHVIFCKLWFFEFGDNRATIFKSRTKQHVFIEWEVFPRESVWPNFTKLFSWTDPRHPSRYSQTFLQSSFMMNMLIL